jgi:hypothetical protein
MGNITKLNDILCYNINAIDNIVAGIGGDLLKWDDNDFCLQSPTPTPTPSPTPGGASPTPTPTPTPTPCTPGCCAVELCYDPRSCNGACSCTFSATYYLSIPCDTDPCDLNIATGIYLDSRCGTPAPAGYYVQMGECYYWDGSSTITYNGAC